MTVTVREVNEGPEVISGESSFTIDENQDLPSAVYTGFDPEGGMVTRWTVGGTGRWRLHHHPGGRAHIPQHP